MKTAIIVIKFLFIGALFIVGNHNLHLGQSHELSEFGNLYYSWLGSVFDNSKVLVGYVIKSEWLPGFIDPIDNSTLQEFANQSSG